MSLHDLLERIRPAGTPGPGAEGEVQRREAERLAEVAEIMALLQEFEAEAAALVAAAEGDAASIVEQARLRARQISSQVPGRVARAVVEVAETSERHTKLTEGQIRSSAEDQAVDLLAHAEDRIPGLVDRALHLIWTAVDEEREQPG